MRNYRLSAESQEVSVTKNNSNLVDIQGRRSFIETSLRKWSNFGQKDKIVGTGVLVNHWDKLAIYDTLET
ncbi:hypothetical protein TNCV_2200391 [Trichonephila clavipes]|nr:hypothetical protein TNCV_2200391 [Trichonephila clavipes]